MNINSVKGGGKKEIKEQGRGGEGNRERERIRGYGSCFGFTYIPSHRWKLGKSNRKHTSKSICQAGRSMS